MSNDKLTSEFDKSYQKRLINQIIMEQKFASVILPIIDPLYFDDEIIKLIIRTLIDAYVKDDTVLNFETLTTRVLSHRAFNTPVKKERLVKLIEEIRTIDSNDFAYVRERAITFCKQQELRKAAKKVLKIADSDNPEAYYECESIIKDALEKGNEDDNGIDVAHNLENVLSEDFRNPIPTGIKGLDECMGGGLSKKEVALVIAPSGVGKAQPLFSKVLTPNGWTTMGEIKVGDKVITQSGEETNVVGVYPQGKRPIYRLTSENGRVTHSDEEHIWYNTNDGNNYLLKDIIENDVNLSVPILNSDNEKILSIEYHGEEEAQCIMVDDDSHLYVTDDYIVTHNTTLTTKIANEAFNAGKNVVQLFFEDTEEQIQRKHYTCWTGIESKDLFSRRDDVIKTVKEKTDRPNKLILLKLPSFGTTMRSINQALKKIIANGTPIDMVILDYIDCVQADKSAKDVHEAEGLSMRQFETMVSELNIAGWVATQGNRDSMSAEIVQASQTGGSIKKVQIGHFVMSIAKTLEQREEGVANIAILKSRFGKDGITFNDCVFDNATMTIDTNANAMGYGDWQQAKATQVQNTIINALK